jgi:hypothetical protein
MFTPPTTITVLGTPNQPHLQSFIVQLFKGEQRQTIPDSPCSMHKHIALPTDHICQVNDIVLTQLQLIIDSVSVIKGADRFYFRNQGSTPFHQYHPNTRKIFT